MDYTDLENFLKNKEQRELVLPAKEYFADISMPETWDDLKSFVEWYLEVRMPLMVPWNSTMAVTDNTTSVPLFRKFPYLVEMHLIHPGCNVPDHSHPGIEVIVMIMGGGGNTIAEWGDFKRELAAGEYYRIGDANQTKQGLVYMTFSKWPDDWLDRGKNFGAGIMSQWCGPVIGPTHQSFIKKFVSDDIDATTKTSVDLDTEPVIAKIPSSEYFKDIVIPDTWDTIEDFTEWWIKNKMPLMVPHDAEVIISDDATAVCVFRHDRYQIEFYIIRPHYTIGSHCHPGMEVMTIYFGGGSTCSPGVKTFHNTANMWGRVRAKLESGQYHGGGENTDVFYGFLLVAIQKWSEGIPMSSAAVNWKGNTAGPLQEALIKKHRPDVIVEPGYADITRLK